jgi:hypothetical protein
MTMPKLTGGRSGFREWVDKQPDQKWPLMPLTHITRGIGAEDIANAGKIAPDDCRVFGEPLAYFFTDALLTAWQVTGPLK